MTNKPTFNLENQAEYGLIAGVDEAGCGPLAGPVVAGAVIFLTQDLPGELRFLINDSKKMTEKQREKAFEMVMSLPESVVCIGVGQASVREIDDLNIGGATRLAMERAVADLSIQPEFALIDGIRKPSLSCPLMTVIKGDAVSLSIAAASIVAKVTRDHIMKSLDKLHPSYGWKKNAGYGTAVHREAIHIHGITPHHRRSFEPVKSLVAGAN